MNIVKTTDLYTLESEFYVTGIISVKKKKKRNKEYTHQIFGSKMELPGEPASYGMYL